MNKVSLLICCYNGASYIDSCVQCILQQTFLNIEVIFVNDGSTDDSIKLIENYKEAIEKKGMKLHILSQKNQGAGYAASLGLQHATGDFITCFDVDDYLYPESIEKKVQFLIEHPDYDIVRTNGYEVCGDNKKLFITNENEKCNTNIFEALLFGQTNNWAGSYMIRANKLWEVYPNHIIPGSRFGQNLQLLLATSYNHKSGFIDEPLMIYYRNNSSFTGKIKTIEENIKLLDGFKSIREQILYDVLKIKDKKYSNKLNIFYSLRKKQLGIDYNNKEIFNANYIFLKSQNIISNLDNHYYYRFHNKFLISLYYRLLYFILKK